MKDTLIYLLTQIAQFPDDVTVTEEASERRSILTVHVNPEDMGRIIGKNGRIIRSIRDLIKLMAAKQNVYVDVVLAEEVKTA